MFELKYFAKIDAYEREEKTDKDPTRLPAFDLNILGVDSLYKRAVRRFTRWFFLAAFWVLRAWWPVARFGRLVIVTRYADVQEVLKHPERFPVPFGPEMQAITDGESFALGLDGEAHQEQREIVDAVIVRSPQLLRQDVDFVLARTRRTTELLLEGSGGRIDVMRDLLGRVFTETCSDYFGLDLDEPNAFLDRTMAISALLFADPFGEEKTRKLALNGAVRVRYLIDRAIERAMERERTNAAGDSLVDRLVRHRRPGRVRVPKERIRAIVIGIITGFVPTNTLGAGKMVEELQRRGLLQSAIGAASAAEALKTSDPVAAKGHRRELQKILLEAFRLNPALSPGQFRHAPKATTVAGKPVPAGSFVVAATMSALRDHRQFPSPGAYDPERPVEAGRTPGPAGSTAPELMFGEGPHVCPGAHLAREQITEIFQILFSRPGIRLASDPAGWLAYVGPFPRRLDFVFQPTAASSTQNQMTIQAKLEPGSLDEVKEMISALGNPAVAGSPIDRALKRTGLVHFASLSAFDAKDPDDKEAEPDPRLLFELNVDGDEDTALARIARRAGPLLEPIFRRIAGSKDMRPEWDIDADEAIDPEAPIDPDRLPKRYVNRLHFLLERHKTKLHFVPWGAIGLNFNGTPDTPVGDIEKQEQVATFARQAVDHYLHVHDGIHKRAVDALAYVRALTLPSRIALYDTSHFSPANAQTEAELMEKGWELRDFLIRPTRRRLSMSEWSGYDAALGLQGLPATLRSNAGIFVALLLGTTVCLQGGAIHYAVNPDPWIAVGLAVAGAVFGTVLIIATAIRDGFNTLVRWWMEGVEGLATVVAFVLSAVAGVLFFVFLLVRWLRWPAGFIGFGAASFWALRRWWPALSLDEQIVLAMLGGGAATVLVVGFGSRMVSPLLRAWQTVALALAGAAATFWALQHWAPELPLSGRIALTGLGALVAANIVPPIWARAGMLLRRYPIFFKWMSSIAAAAVLVYVLRVHWKQVSCVVDQLGSLSLALAGGMVATFLLWLIPTLLFLAVLYWHEVCDDKDIDRRPAPLETIEAIAAKENPPGYAQNHITAVTVMKKGAFRKVTLALALWVIGKEVQYWFRPGFVLNMGTIHYARWFRLPGSEMMLFLANYDGSWLSYLEDFITKAHEGQSAVWSHGRGFPKTRLLVLGGAADGDRFKRWVRRQQIVTQFWYSRFPQLTTDQIRTNALIHDGLMRAQTDTAARAWLDCFGTMPRPEDAIETDEVQSLVFRGLPTHDYMLCATLILPKNAAARREWLKLVSEEVTFGEQPDVEHTTATFVAFSARGIAKCLNGKEQDKVEKMAAFPPAFRLGMADRAKVLGDTGPSAPRKWRWADIDRAGAREDARAAVDAVLFIYGKDPRACINVLGVHEKKLGRTAVSTVMTEPTQKTRGAQAERKRREEWRAKFAGESPPTGGQDGQAGDATPTSERDNPMYEHFGFRDGISQPILRGSQREAATDNKADVVEAGEVILGYKDGAGYMAPALTLEAESDPGDDLETDTPDFPSRFPRFAGSRDTDLRDFGRNGTFVVVRQLMQKVEDFEDFLVEQKQELKTYKGLTDSVGGPITENWIAAKMMGRWQTGASLISHPHEMTGRRMTDKVDNDFSFAKDDPQGLHCPFGAHIRRANPRGSLAPNDPKQAMIEKRHRILRRGRPYGDKGSERGLLFVALCADLERQFEFLQQSWIGSPSFHGLNNEPDPITAPPPQRVPGQKRQSYVFTIPTPSGPITMKNLRSFVTVKAGGYFFMPGRSALRFLTNLTRQ
ncbi:MAG: cytochrome P450 [Reyranella sp.]|uniref:cytochrome P450 n=1 Tax=Reyranella sp. TaxID=1929291 RepID=UPI00121ECDEB|nr:cytochrome P450 [Reyranella sp.]TAJ35663.1 MAG: cytochrome P450 [Reyranella sp.]